MTGRRRLIKQIKKIREIFDDIIKHSELLEQAAIRAEADKGQNILNEIEKDNEDRRSGE